MSSEEKKFVSSIEVLACEPMCVRCGSKEADYVEEPFMKAVYNHRMMVWLCDACYQASLKDI